MVTMDMLVVGKQELDERVRIEAMSVLTECSRADLKGNEKRSGFVRAIESFIDPDLRQMDLK